MTTVKTTASVGGAFVRPGQMSASTPVPARDVTPNQAHADYPPIKIRDDRQVVRKAAQKRLAVTVRMTTWERLKGQNELDHRDYRLTKGDVAARLSKNEERARAQSQAQPDNPDFQALPFTRFESGRTLGLTGTTVALPAVHATANRRGAPERPSAPVHAKIRNQLLPNGGAGASTQGWEQGDLDRTTCRHLANHPTVTAKIKEAMQDTFVCTSFTVTVGGKQHSIQLQGVIDGHHWRDGGRAAAWVESQLAAALTHRLQAHNAVQWHEQDVYDALKLATGDVSRSLKLDNGGACLNASLLIDGQLWGLNVGDSRFILRDDSGFRQASEDVNARAVRAEIASQEAIAQTEDRPVDPGVNRMTKASLQRGGSFNDEGRLDGRLDPCRTLGDHGQLGHNSPRPKLTRFALQTGRSTLAIHVTDGVTDVMSTKQIGEFIERRLTDGVALEQIAAELVFNMLWANGHDNATVLLVPIEPATDPAGASAPERSRRTDRTDPRV